MEIEGYGTPVQFDDLEPGDFFAVKDNGGVTFGIAARFKKDSLNVCVLFDPKFSVNSFAGHMSVWKMPKAIIQPMVRTGSLELELQLAAGHLVLASNGQFLIGSHARNGSVVRINVGTGVIEEFNDPSLIVSKWEVVVQNEKTKQWQQIFERA